MFHTVQLLGVISLVIGVVMVQQKKKENLLILMAVMFSVLAVQYVLTDRMTGLIVAMIIIIRNLVYLGYTKKGLDPSVTVLIIFQMLLIGVAFFTWQNVFSLLPPMATMAITWGTWQDKMKYNRLSLLFGKACFAVYALAAGMYTAMLGHGLEVFSVVFAIWRYDIKK